MTVESRMRGNAHVPFAGRPGQEGSAERPTPRPEPYVANVRVRRK